jgi:hypothetical protein
VRGARLAAVVAGGLALVLLAVSLVLLTLGHRPGTPDCEVTGQPRGQRVTVGLDAAEARSAASVGATGVRRGWSLATTVSVLRASLDLGEEDARVVARALTGRASGALTCRAGGNDRQEPDRLSAHGLTARAEAVRRVLQRAFGRQQLGGFAPGGVNSGHMPGSAHYEGRAVDIFFRPATRAHRVRGWAMAQYLVAQAGRLSVDTVIYDARIWTARRSAEGWRDYRVDTRGRSRETAAVLEHLDHVHVDVAG